MTDESNAELKAEWAHSRNNTEIDPPESVIDVGKPVPFVGAVRNSDNAWRGLLFLHMPFHLDDAEAHNKLLNELDALEIAESESRNAVRKAEDATQRRTLRSMGWQRRARLMEQAFVNLRLDRYANAPINRGWMNLFRDWSEKDTEFDRHLMENQAKFTDAFIVFYASFVRGKDPIDEQAIPHPWDSESSDTRRHYRDDGLTPKKKIADGERAKQAARADKWWATKARPPMVFLDSGMFDVRREPTFVNPPPGAPASKEAPPQPIDPGAESTPTINQAPNA